MNSKPLNPFLTTYSGDQFPNGIAAFDGRIVVMESYSFVEEPLFNLLQFLDRAQSRRCKFYMTEFFKLEQLSEDMTRLKIIENINNIGYDIFCPVALAFSHEFIDDYIFTSDSGQYIGYYHWNFDVMVVIYKSDVQIPTRLIEEIPRISTFEGLLEQIVSVGARPNQDYINKIFENYAGYFLLD